MALEQATAQQRMGRATIRRLANAQLVPDGGVAVAGIFSERPIDANLGPAGMQTHDVSFRAVSDELPQDMARGDACSVFVGAQRQILKGRYEVRHREDNALIGTSVLDLSSTA